jgi:hypothetical protein
MWIKNLGQIFILVKLFQNRLLIFAVFIAFALLGISCTEQSTKTSETSFVSPTSAISPTQTFVIPSTATFTATPELEIKSPTHCQEIISSQLQNDFSRNGSIIFEGECEGQDGLFKLSVENQKIEPFLDNLSYGKSFLGSFITPFYVSRDHQWLMYENRYYDSNDTYLGTFMNITGEDENSLIQYPLNGNWLSPMGWYGNNLAGFSVLRAPYFSMDILAPFSGNVTRFGYAISGFGRAELLFDPPIARALYFDDLASHYFMKEIATDKILWQSAKDNMATIYANQPRWSPNGLFFAIPVWDEAGNGKFRFLAVSREGREIMTDEVFQSNPESPYVNFTWSDSGNYLVFWNSVENVGKQLIIWDVASNQFIDTGFTTLNDPSLPVFSPDEAQFIVNVRILIANENFNRVNYLVDMVSGKAIQLDLELFPVAWLKPLELGQSIVRPAEEPDLILPKNGNAVKQQCVENLNSNEPIPQYMGGVVFFRDRFLYTLMSNEEINKPSIDGHKLMNAFVSPNRKSLFYWYEDESDNYTPHYWLTSLTGQSTEIVTDNIVPSYDAIHGWSNDQELWVSARSSNSDLFNPFEKTFRAMPEFGDPQMAGCIDWLICSYLDGPSVLYDTQFEQEVFATASSVILMDRDANFLWQYENWLITLNLPKWSPDEQYLGVPLPLDEDGDHYEFFIVDRDGKARQLTNYSSAYSTLAIDKFQWSPDGRYIAFWADTHSQEGIAQRNPYRLFVLDTETRQTADYCVSGNYADNNAPVWSPDGSQIAVNSIKDGKRLILLVDFETGVASQVAVGELVGWMTTP